MPVVLDIPEISERVLYAAVRSLDPTDFNGFWQIARVMLAGYIPSVHNAILKCSEYHTFERAMRTGHVALLLDKWKASSLPLRYNAQLLQQADFPEGTIAADSAIFASVDAIAAGTQTELDLEYQAITDAGIEALNAAMASLTQALVSLNLHGSTINCRRLSALSFPASLKSLNLGQSWIPDTVHKRWLEDWTWPEHLEHIDLTGNAFHPRYTTSFLESLPPGLKSLDLTFNQLGDTATLAVVKNLPHTVTLLDLSNNEITGPGFEAICLHLPPALESLSMIGNRLGTAVTQHKLVWSFPATVTKLVFNGTNLHTNGTLALTLALPPNLETLHVKSAMVSVASAKIHFPALPATLRSLAFSSNSDCRSAAIKNLIARNLPAGLERLTLMSAGVDEAFAEYLFARLPRTLLHLNVNGSVVSASGLAALARNMPPNLETLCLRYSVVTPRGMRLLAPALPATLRELDLANNFRMTDEAAQTLADHMPPALEKLVLRATRVSAVGQEAIRNAAPASLTDIQFRLEGDLQKYAHALGMVANGIPISADGDE
ncbi:hypothetical protein H9P43_009421 [Blastocladiella emersonii ATCC 22665]|nr:hypothetical protein H9P43_009421 [Blastocladiella emersonii ATCC 22665]